MKQNTTPIIECLLWLSAAYEDWLVQHGYRPDHAISLANLFGLKLLYQHGVRA